MLLALSAMKPVRKSSGIPFGIQHLKLAEIALAPIGKIVVTKEVAAAARKRNAEAVVAGLRRDF